MSEKTIYTIGLHETIVTSSGVCIMRVAGGWIYDCWDLSSDVSKLGVFVPFDNEFQD